jgi:hypothetical protein
MTTPGVTNFLDNAKASPTKFLYCFVLVTHLKLRVQM